MNQLKKKKLKLLMKLIVNKKLIQINCSKNRQQIQIHLQSQEKIRFQIKPIVQILGSIEILDL